MLNKTRLLAGATALATAGAIGTTHAQVGRGSTEWLTAGADAQRTSWIRTDPKISVTSMSQPGFELQWTARLGAGALAPGVTANGVTLFIPMSIVAGASSIYALDNDTGYVVWQRTLSSASTPCGLTAATRIVPLVPPPIAATQTGGGRAAQAYRSVIGQPGEGAPVEVRGGGPGRGAQGVGGAPGAGGAQGARGAGGAQGAPGAGGAPGAPGAPGAGAPPQRAGGGFGPPPGPPIPGATQEQTGGGRGGLGRPSGVVYALASDGTLHVLGLPSGKDIQRPAEFVPLNAGWSDTIAVNTTLYATTTSACGNAPNGVWAIDLDSDSKPVASWKSNGGPIVGRLAFASDGTIFATIGPGAAAGDGKANAIVALDPKSLALKNWFTQPGLEFVTGPSVFKHGDREIVAAATKDGRIVLLDAASLGGANHTTPLHVSVAVGAIAADAIATWQEMTITQPSPPPPASTTTATTTTSTTAPAQTTPPQTAPAQPPAAPAPAPQPIVTLGTRWILAPAANGIVALKLNDTAGALTLERAWNAPNVASPATPIVVNGVVFALATGRAPTAAGGPAVLHAYDGTSGKELWTSGTAMAAQASPGSFWSAMSQVYVGTTDGTLYTFGFLDERR
jgi:hypothetical protein